MAGRGRSRTKPVWSGSAAGEEEVDWQEGPEVRPGGHCQSAVCGPKARGGARREGSRSGREGRDGAAGGGQRGAQEVAGNHQADGRRAVLALRVRPGRRQPDRWGSAHERAAEMQPLRLRSPRPRVQEDEEATATEGLRGHCATSAGRSQPQMHVLKTHANRAPVLQCYFAPLAVLVF